MTSAPATVFDTALFLERAERFCRLGHEAAELGDALSDDINAMISLIQQGGDISDSDSGSIINATQEIISVINELKNISKPKSEAGDAP